MKQIKKSMVLNDVCYDIRGPILQEAMRLEEEGMKIIKLNIGNTAPFGLEAPEELIHDMIMNIRNAQGYCDSKGIFPARKAVMQYHQQKGVNNISTDNIYIGNGVSELIKISMEALLNNSDEILIPTPDYPLWTASVNLARGKAVHYICDEKSEWQPDLKDIEKKITPKTKGIVIINPNNPTGAVYKKEILQKIVSIAEKHSLIIFSDEIYDKILYDNSVHYNIAAMTDKVLVVTFGGISKNYRAPGFRVGWMVLSGNRAIANDYIEGINILSSMRLCSNVPGQHVVQTSLGGKQSILKLTANGGRLQKQRDLAWKMITSIPGISCVKPKGALYLFPKIDIKKYKIKDDYQMVLDILLKEKVLVTQGTGFNWPEPDHFRMIFLPHEEILTIAINRIANYFSSIG
ncbi:MAG: pyridoxal phosphate-dependent aminotransferase [Spirochaetes bacterium]|nr:pyridoxal phosphate-dependent aminotransferase [Spirochaetota bacterium]